MHHPPPPRRERPPATEPAPLPEFPGPSGDVIGPTEAAAMLGVSRQRVHQYIAAGRFVTAARVDGRWTIDRAEVDWMGT